MDTNKELLLAKIALLKMIHQFMYKIEIDSELYYDHYSEGAGEAAFKVLGISERIKVKELCELHEQLERQLWRIALPNEEYGGFLAKYAKGIYY